MIHSSEQAAALWQALLAGRWTIVERFDSAERRYLLARESVPDQKGHTELTVRQRAALDLRARGRSLKFIGYELGLAPTTVCMELRRAREKLGVKSDFDLSAVFGWCQAND